MASTTATRRGTDKAPAPRRARNAAPDALVERAAQNTLAANPLIGIRRKEVLAAASTLIAQLARQPKMVGRQYAKFVRELSAVVAGRSTLAPARGDRRFADAAWSERAGFRRLLQAYVALAGGLDRCVDEAKLDPVATDRARFVVSLLVDAIAPTNFIATNPAALRKLADTRGAS